MKNVDIVIGLNYGDEGKGGVVNHHTKKAGEHTAVVRFNSGCQAGHTVTVGEKRNVFHQLGAGSFQCAPTILSRFVVVNPIMFCNEILDFYKTYPSSRRLTVFIDPEALVTTPYDVLINQQLEESRSTNRHGSCGLGFGETIERAERGFPLRVKDICEDDFEEKIAQIRDEYYPERMAELGLDTTGLTETLLVEADQRFIEDATDMVYYSTILDDRSAMDMYDNLIFEGAQGLCLDQNSIDFPYVTRSNTGLENVSVLLEDIDANINVHYVTRSYLTRHGAGPLNGEYIPSTPIVDCTNVFNGFQLKLRFAKLDYKRMKSDVARDIKFLEGRKFKIFGVITCCDQYKQVTGDDDISVLISRVSNAIHTTNISVTWRPGELS